jgi:hypothetical protein
VRDDGQRGSHGAQGSGWYGSSQNSLQVHGGQRETTPRCSGRPARPRRGRRGTARFGEKDVSRARSTAGAVLAARRGNRSRSVARRSASGKNGG